MIKEGEVIVGTAARRANLSQQVKCARGHLHRNDVKVTECDDRLALRVQYEIDMALRRDAGAKE
jgi:hypothetical protein